MRRRTWSIIVAIAALTAVSLACGVVSPEPQSTDTPMLLADSPISTHTSRPSPMDTPVSIESPSPLPTGTPQPTDTPKTTEIPQPVATHVVVEGQETIRLTGRSVAIYNLVGNVEIERGTGDAVEVDVRPGGSDADSLRIATGEIDGRQTVRVIYPANVIGLRGFTSHRFATNLEVGDDGTFGERARPGGRRVWIAGGSWPEVIVPSGPRFDAYANMTVVVPEGRQLEINAVVGRIDAVQIERALMLYTSIGDVTAREVDGEVEVGNSSGKVVLEGIAGGVKAKTSFGDVTVRDVDGETEVESSSGELVLEGIARRVKARTSTGSITLELGDQFAGKLEMSTGTSGTIDVDVAGAQVVSSNEHEMTLVISHGEETSTLRTVSGTIFVRRRD